MWVYLGRKPSVDVEKVRELKDSGMGASAIAKLKIINYRDSSYRSGEMKEGRWRVISGEWVISPLRLEVLPHFIVELDGKYLFV